MTISQLYSYIQDLRKKNTFPVEIKSREISEGDRYHSEQGLSLDFKILDNHYSVGYLYITEDDDDWAQAECYEVNWCHCNDKNISPDVVHKLIENYHSEIRDKILNQLI